MEVWERGEEGEAAGTHTTQLTVKCRTGETARGKQSWWRNGGGRGYSGGCMESNEPSPIRVCRLRGSGPCLLADKVNGKSVFHARSINTAPARRDKFL